MYEPHYKIEDDEDLITTRIKCDKCGISLSTLQESNIVCECPFYEKWIESENDGFDFEEDVVIPLS